MAKSMAQNQQPHKSKIGSYTNDNILEAVRGIGSSVGKTVTTDVVSKISQDALMSILGSAKSTSGELRPNQPVQLTEKPERREEQRPRRMPREFSRPMWTHEDAEIKKKIDAVRHELMMLAESVKKLHQEVQNSVLETPVNPGVYHINFYDQLRTFIQALRVSVEDSGAWLSACNSRKKKIGYWGMFKKHGTTFGLSGERNLATSAG